MEPKGEINSIMITGSSRQKNQGNSGFEQYYKPNKTYRHTEVIPLSSRICILLKHTQDVLQDRYFRPENKH
jgi:hypothetical protein